VLALIKRFIAITLLAALLSACSGVPGDEEIEILVRDNLLTDGLGDLFSLESFNKTNGFRESDNVYIVRANPTGPQYGMFGSKLVLTAIQSNFGQFEVGDKIHKVEKVRLHRTEQGWQIAK
jgi:hypothetical protein